MVRMSSGPPPTPAMNGAPGFTSCESTRPTSVSEMPSESAAEMVTGAVAPMIMPGV